MAVDVDKIHMLSIRARTSSLYDALTCDIKRLQKVRQVIDESNGTLSPWFLRLLWLWPVQLLGWAAVTRGLALVRLGRAKIQICRPWSRADCLLLRDLPSSTPES